MRSGAPAWAQWPMRWTRPKLTTLQDALRAAYPDAVFLAEAFTRPAPMTTLAKVGFSQSYTYFTWKNTKAELVELVEQARSWSACWNPSPRSGRPLSRR